MNGLELNKIAASVLLAGVVAMGVGIITNDLLYPNAQEHHAGAEHGAEGKQGEEKAEEGAGPKRGYTIPGAEAFEKGAAGGGAATADAGPVDIALYLEKADAKAGEAVTKKCATCHDFTKGGPNKVGPNLWGVLGGPVAHKGDFEYSQTFKDAHGKGEKWDWQHISEFINNPKKVMPGTKMAFAGIGKPEERANLLAYLRTLSDTPIALPPAPKSGTPETTAPATPGTTQAGTTQAAPVKDTPNGAAEPAEDAKPGEAKPPAAKAAEAKTLGAKTAAKAPVSPDAAGKADITAKGE